MPLTIEHRLREAGVERVMLPMGKANPDLQHVNAWRIGPSVLVDTGKDDAETRNAWQHAGGLGGITDIVCTHGHPDHMGLAHHFEAAYGARIQATTLELDAVRLGFNRAPDAKAGLRRKFLLDMGGLRSGASPTTPLGGSPTRPPVAPLTLEDGDRLAFEGGAWRVQLGGGHSPRPALFINDAHDLVITGDQILPDTAPYVGVSFGAPDADPMSDMIAFLNAWTHVNADCIALPGHGAPFTDPGRRARAHLASYERRLAHVWAAAERPLTCADLLPSLFRVSAGSPVLDIHYTMAAALLNHLVAADKMQRWRDADGPLLYQQR